jgi:hypothetical protein
MCDRCRISLIGRKDFKESQHYFLLITKRPCRFQKSIALNAEAAMFNSAHRHRKFILKQSRPVRVIDVNMSRCMAGNVAL